GQHGTWQGQHARSAKRGSGSPSTGQLQKLPPGPCPLRPAVVRLVTHRSPSLLSLLRPLRLLRLRTPHIQTDGAEVRHLIECMFAAQPADPAALAGDAAKRNVQLPVVGRIVDVHDPGAQALGEPESAAEIAGE